MPESITITAEFNASKQKIYRAWLNSKSHTEFTGSPANVSSRKGGKFTAWEGYITGKNLELHPYEKIIQAWRTTEFDEKDPDSILEIRLTEKNGITKVTLKHTNIPDGQGKGYKQGWIDFYFRPMSEYFTKAG